MARCGCSGSYTGVIIGGAGIDVTGSASAVDPLIIAADCPETVACVGAHLGSGLAYDAAAGRLVAKRSADANNALVFGSDGGLKVPATGGGGTGGVLTAPSGTITWSGTGLPGSPLVASIVPAVLAAYPRGRIANAPFTVNVSGNEFSTFNLATFTFTAGRRMRVSISLDFWSGASNVEFAGWAQAAGTRSASWWKQVPPYSNINGVYREFPVDGASGPQQVQLAAHTPFSSETVTAQGQVWLTDDGPA